MDAQQADRRANAIRDATGTQSRGWRRWFSWRAKGNATLPSLSLPFSAGRVKGVPASYS
jgi:hypothetical protein